MSAGTTPPQRVAIRGGSWASLAPAFERRRPGHPGRCAITVQPLGGRLGGKGASGPAPRIEEHGLQLGMGFCVNAFALLPACHAERCGLHPDERLAAWRDAFKPAPDVTMADRLGEDSATWRAHFAPGQGAPGDPRAGGSPFTVLAYLRQSAEALARSGALLQVAHGPAVRAHGHSQSTPLLEATDALSNHLFV